MQLKIPPVLVMAICIGLMWLVDYFWALNILSFAGSRYVAHGIFGLGILWAVFGLWEFNKESTTSDPRNVQNASALVDSGIYSISRNPMYVGMLCIVISAVFYLENLLTVFVVPLFVIYMNQYQIIPEEEMMEKKFGDAYRSYKSEVGRWL